MKHFSYDIADDKGAGWIRLGSTGTGPGIRFTTREPMFSERYGIRRPFMVVGKRRFFWLKREKL